MIVEPVTYHNEQQTVIDAFFSREKYGKALPTEAKDFILENLGLYTFIKELDEKHLETGKKMLEMGGQIKIHPPVSLNREAAIEELIEKAKKSSSVIGEKAYKALTLLEENPNQRSAFQNFKLYWTRFLKELLEEMIKEKQGSS